MASASREITHGSDVDSISTALYNKKKDSQILQAEEEYRIWAF